MKTGRPSGFLLKHLTLPDAAFCPNFGCLLLRHEAERQLGILTCHQWTTRACQGPSGLFWPDLASCRFHANQSTPGKRVRLEARRRFPQAATPAALLLRQGCRVLRRPGTNFKAAHDIHAPFKCASSLCPPTGSPYRMTNPRQIGLPGPTSRYGACPHRRVFPWPSYILQSVCVCFGS